MLGQILNRFKFIYTIVLYDVVTVLLLLYHSNGR